MVDRLGMKNGWAPLLALALLSALAIEARGQGRRPRVTLYLERVSGPAVVFHRVSQALQNALAARAEYELTSLEEILEPTASSDRRLVRAEAEAARGRALLDNLQVPEGVVVLTRAALKAEAAFARATPGPATVARLTAVLVELAFAHHLSGDRTRCEQALGEVFAINPRLELDTKKYPPEMRRVFESTRFLMDELGQTSLEVRTIPAGAVVRINGGLVGYGPVRAPGLMVGPNLVSVSQPGYRTTTRVVSVDASRSAKATVELSELQGNVAGLLHAALLDAHRGANSTWLAQAAARLRQRDLLFLGTLAAGADVVAVNLYAFDAASSRVAARIGGAIAVNEAEGESDSLIASLIATLGGPPVDGVRSRPPGPSWLQRFYRGPYFWPVVGGVAAAAVVGTGIGIGVYYGTRGSDRERRFIMLLR